MAEFKLHCFAQSGNSYKVALMLNLSEADWEAVWVDFFKGIARTSEWREAVNAMGELPVLEHGARRLTQSGVVLTYLARRLGKFGPKNEDEELEILRWILFDNHKFTGYMSICRFLNAFAPKAPDPAVMAFLNGRVNAAYTVVDQHLAGRDFIIGDRPTIADISLAGYVYYPKEEHGFDFAESYPNICGWMERIKALPGWVDPYQLMPGERFLAER